MALSVVFDRVFIKPGLLLIMSHDLLAVTRNCRPDWDFTTPDMRIAWQQGRYDRLALRLDF